MTVPWPHAGELTRFLAIGLLNTIFGYSIYGIAVLAGATPAIALLAAIVSGVFFNYFTTGRVVFRHALSAGKFVKFAASYGVIYGFNLVLLRAILANGVGPFTAQAMCLPIVVIFTFLVMKLIVFRK